jgi:hypothetical protein
MKRIYHFFVFAASFVLLFTACSKEGDKDAGFLAIDGKNYILTYGMVDEAELGGNDSYRNYWLRFQSSEGDHPSHFIFFNLCSFSTSAIEEGTYTYDYIQTEAGDFTWVKVGYDLQYDEDGELTDGTLLLDSYVEEGSLVVTAEGELLKFEFNIRFIRNQTTYVITGEFRDVLYDRDISYFDI